MHLKGVHDRCVLIQNEKINVMLLVIIISSGLRSFDENVYMRGFISVWNLDVCTFSTFLGYVGIEEDMLSRGGCILTCIFNSIFLVNLMLTLPHGLGPWNYMHAYLSMTRQDESYQVWCHFNTKCDSNVPQHSKFKYAHIKVAKN